MKSYDGYRDKWNDTDRARIRLMGIVAVTLSLVGGVVMGNFLDGKKVYDKNIGVDRIIYEEGNRRGVGYHTRNVLRLVQKGKTTIFIDENPQIFLYNITDASLTPDLKRDSLEKVVEIIPTLVNRIHPDKETKERSPTNEDNLRYNEIRMQILGEMQKERKSQ